ncbi:glutathione S-transferase family protein [Iodobacter ciconiae]|uniref:Glutathione S-transferase family protein n=1 Tax=Iodobacter ciconiae TaxID=2496266 RepID=A0A3S8ZUG7_9NEIS|nr:glutathione S-transferase family protein [Iodobacter ciconiae]AZN37091.1 glutathione S-transferase family protein [Iodobacter ciconiae]
MNAALILHHYQASPYSEKIRSYLGFKQLAWQSLLMPMLLPKPDLMELTGGYRRAPVLQIGADIYCDSALIIQELERRFPQPALASGPQAAQAGLLGRLFDVDIFWRAVRYLMACRIEHLPQALLDDRIAMHPQLPLQKSQLLADQAQLAIQLQALINQVDQALSGRDYLGGTHPCAGDFAVYHTLWFLQGAQLLADFIPNTLLPWMGKMAALGHGQMRSVTASEAFAAGNQAQPAALAEMPDSLFKAGQKVLVQPEGYPQESVAGELVYLDEQKIVIARQSTVCGLLHVHFPRMDYDIRAV